MELAYHIRAADSLSARFPVFASGPEGEASGPRPEGRDGTAPEAVAAMIDLAPADFLSAFSGKIGRIYAGDEFCVHRLPSPKEFAEIHRRTDDLGMKLTLLTPPLTDDGLDRLSELLASIPGGGNGWDGLEVVANDWGTVRFVHRQDGNIALGAGRLLNKGFKDPRLPDPAAFRAFSDNARILLDTGTFDHPGMAGRLASWGVRRMERDLFPFAETVDVSRFPSTIYLPYGYVTTGRFCRTASFQNDRPKFAALSSCGRPCRRLSFRLAHADSRFPLIQNGNAVFYRYASEMAATVPLAPGLRLVYQGDAL